MKKPHIPKKNKTDCEYIFEEMKYCRNYILELALKIEKEEEKLRRLESWASKFLCE